VPQQYRVLLRSCRDLHQAAKQGHRIDHARRVRTQTDADDLGPGCGIGRHGLRRQQRQNRIRDRLTAIQEILDPPCVIRDLLEQDRREVHHGTRLRGRLQVCGHIGVVLHRMEVGPREGVGLLPLLEILRLVHVPAQHDVQTRFRRLGGRALSGHNARVVRASRA